MSRRARVFIVQEPMKLDKPSGQMVSVFNFNKAAEYGELMIMLPAGQVGLSPAPTIFRLNECLADFGDEDYLLAAGDTAAIAIASMIAASKNRGRVKLLKYDRDARSYIRVDIDIHKKLGATQLT